VKILREMRQLLHIMLRSILGDDGIGNGGLICHLALLERVFHVYDVEQWLTISVVSRSLTCLA
jgi:hypothetical protein